MYLANYVNGREVGIDFSKNILAFLVVLGHLLQIGISQGDLSSISSWMKYAIYSFHMPLFIFITGYLYSKRITDPPKRFFKKKFNQLVYPSIIWGIVLLLFDAIFNNQFSLQLLKDSIIYYIWYPKSLFIVFLICFPFLYTQKPFWAIIAFLISLLFGAYFMLALQLPAFICGWYYSKYENTRILQRVLFLFFIVFIIELCVIHPSLKSSGLNVLANCTFDGFLNYSHRLLLAISGSVVFFIIIRYLGHFIIVLSSAIINSRLAEMTLGVYLVQSIIVERLVPMLFSITCWYLYIPISIVFFIICSGIVYLLRKNSFLRGTVGIKN